MYAYLNKHSAVPLPRMLKYYGKSLINLHGNIHFEVQSGVFKSYAYKPFPPSQLEIFDSLFLSFGILVVFPGNAVISTL